MKRFIKYTAAVTVLVCALTVFAACTTTYDTAQSQAALEKGMTAIKESDNFFITLRQANDKGEMLLKYKVQSYISDQSKYPEGTRLTYIEEFDGNGNVINYYWAGKNASKKGSDTQSWAIRKVYDKKADKNTYYYQKTDTDDIWTDEAFASRFGKDAIMKDWFGMTAEDYEIVSGKKAGKVETVQIKVKEEYNPFLSSLKDYISVKITDGFVTSIRDEHVENMFSTVTTYQIDFLVAGPYITIPNIPDILKNIEKNADFAKKNQVIEVTEGSIIA